MSLAGPFDRGSRLFTDYLSGKDSVYIGNRACQVSRDLT